MATSRVSNPFQSQQLIDYLSQYGYSNDINRENQRLLSVAPAPIPAASPDVPSLMTSFSTWNDPNQSAAETARLLRQNASPSYLSDNMMPAGTNTDSVGGWFDGLLGGISKLAKDSGFVGYKDANGNEIAGWGGDVLKGLMGFGSLINGRQQLALAKETLAMNKDLAYKNFNNQRTMVNSQLADRQRSRVSADPTHYESVDSYMSKNRVV